MCIMSSMYVCQVSSRFTQISYCTHINEEQLSFQWIKPTIQTFFFFLPFIVSAYLVINMVTMDPQNLSNFTLTEFPSDKVIQVSW